MKGLSDDSPMLKNQLKKHRKQKGLSQADLASNVGVSRQTIHSVEASKSIPSLELALKLSDVLDAKVEDLLKVLKELKSFFGEISDQEVQLKKKPTDPQDDPGDEANSPQNES